jgi:hypothetical protein
VVKSHPEAPIVEWGEPAASLLLVAGQRSGGIWAGFDGAVDALRIERGDKTAIYDFEPEASACQKGAYSLSAVPRFEGLDACLAYHKP